MSDVLQRCRGEDVDPQLQIVVEETAKTPESQTIQAQTLKSFEHRCACGKVPDL